jgi:uncharacterized membrane protein
MDRRSNLIAAGLGAGLMYLCDPDRGRRRRALLRDQAVHAAHKTADGLWVASRDLANRTRGLAAVARVRFNDDEAGDAVLAERARAKLGLLVRHPHSIQVTVEGNRVILSGPVLADEVERLLSGVSRVRGVGAVENRLAIHQRPDNVPGLQGSPLPPRGERPEFLQTYWSPTARLMAVLGGAGLIGAGARMRGPRGSLATGAGLALLVRGVTNVEFKRLIGVGSGRRAVDIQKTIKVAAPVEEIFRFWTNYENFPRFMAHVNEVRSSGEGKLHWTVTGPGGVPLQFETVVTELVPNRLIAWKTVPGSPFASSGVVRFQQNSDGSTRLDIKMCYNPPAGALGHAVAALFGADPKHAMDDDLVRFKSLIEYGKATAHGHTVRRDELVGASPETGTAPA